MIYPALSLIEPWLQIILDGTKTVEFRTWRRENVIGKKILLCSSKRTHRPSINKCLLLGWLRIKGVHEFMPYLGHARCIVRIKDIVPAGLAHQNQPGFSYHDDGKRTYAWELENVRPIEPFPVKGSLGIYKVERDEITYL